MELNEGMVAVVTGGASGIGRSVAVGFAEAGLRVVIADIEREALDRVVAEFESAGHDVLGVPTDVSESDSVEALAAATMDRFGAVHVVHNNAGVGAGGPIWTQSEADWKWVLGVNLWGVIHGVRTFVPIMLDQGGPAHVVNTASMAGLISVPQLGAYNVSKHGVVTLSETLWRDLRLADAEIGVSVLCPGLVMTNIFESSRNRPADLSDDGDAALRNLGPVMDLDPAAMADSAASFGEVLSADTVGGAVVDAVRDDTFYILTHRDRSNDLVTRRCDDIVARRHPSPLRVG